MEVTQSFLIFIFFIERKSSKATQKKKKKKKGSCRFSLKTSNAVFVKKGQVLHEKACISNSALVISHIEHKLA